MRTDVVYLPLSEAKCSPAATCPQSGTCARTQAKADTGRALADYTASWLWVRGSCKQYLAASAYRNPPAPSMKPSHDYIKGLL